MLPATMAMEWEIRPLARRCAASDAALEPGEAVVCLLYRDFETGELARADVREPLADDFTPSGDPVARWRRIVKAPGDEGEARREALRSSEELFLALLDESTEPAPDVQALQHLLALLLERKRILRQLGKRQRSGQQTYLHVPTKREIAIPILPLDSEFFAQIQTRLDDLIL